MNWFKSFLKKLAPPAAEPAPASAEPAPDFFASAKERIASAQKHNFTPRAVEVLAWARKESERFNHNFVGTEHLLLGIIKLGDDVSITVLKNQGLAPETARQQIEKNVGQGPDTNLTGRIPYTPRVKKVLALSMREAQALNHPHIGPEHILLGLLREGDGLAARILQMHKIDLQTARNEIIKHFGQIPPQSEATQEAPDPVENYFTPRAMEILALSRQEAQRLNPNFTG